jgi:hypothetical protein
VTAVNGHLMLGAAVSLSGRYASQGLLASSGLQQVVVDARSAGGVVLGGGRVVPGVVVLDDGSTRAGVRRSLDALAAADLIVGPYGSDLVREAARWASERERVREHQPRRRRTGDGHWQQRLRGDRSLACPHRHSRSRPSSSGVTDGPYRSVDPRRAITHTHTPNMAPRRGNRSTERHHWSAYQRPPAPGQCSCNVFLTAWQRSLNRPGIPSRISASSSATRASAASAR